MLARFLGICAVWLVALAAQGSAQSRFGVMGDSGSNNPDSTSIPAPGHPRRFTAEQDSAFARAMRIKVEFDARYRDFLRANGAVLLAYLDSLDNTPDAIRRRNLKFDPKDWQPTEADRARHDEDIARALDWNYLHPNLPYRPMLAVPLHSIFSAIGLAEDVSPHIAYTLTSTQQVSVKIYDLAARIVSTPVNSVQRPGAYSFDWNMTDDSGKHVDSGDYVAEVVVNKMMVLRKHIEVP